MRTPAAIYESFWSGLVIAIDPAVGRWARDPIRAAQVRYRHLFLLVTGQKLQTLIQDTTLFPGHTTSSCCPNAEEPSPSRFAVTHVSGLFCNGSAKYAQGRCPDRAAQGVSPVFRAALRPFRSACGSLSKGGRFPFPLRLATPAFARRRSACRYMPRMA